MESAPPPPPGIPYAPHGFCGLLIPPGNFAAEYEARSLLPPGLLPLTGRLVGGGGNWQERLTRYFEPENLSAALRCFAATPLRVVAVAYSSSSYLIGPEREAAAFRDLAREAGCPVTAAAEATAAALESLGSRRLSLVSPYPAAITEACAQYWQARGFAVERVVELPAGTGFHPIYTIPPATVAAAVRDLRAASSCPVLVTGTGVPLLDLLADVADEPGAPVLSSNLALFWHTAGIAGLPEGRVPFARWLTGDAPWRRRFLGMPGST